MEFWNLAMFIFIIYSVIMYLNTCVNNENGDTHLQLVIVPILSVASM